MSIYSKKDRLIIITGALLTLVTFIFDISFPVGIVGSIPYVAVILLTLYLPDNKFTVLAGISTSILTIIGFFLSPSDILFGIPFDNRLLVIILIVAAVFFIFRYKRAENERRRSEEKLRALFEASPEGLIITDKKGIISMINRRTEELFGYDRTELIDKPIESLIPQRFRKDHVQDRQTYYSNPEQRPMGQGRELYAIRKDDSEFPVEISLNYFKTDEGLFIISYIVDITDRKRSENELRLAHERLKKSAGELRRSNAELEQFAYVASHDLQEPLRMVASYTELLARRYQDKLDQDANDFIHYAVDGAKRMQSLINDLLQFSRVSTKARPFKTCDMKNVTQDAMQNLEELLRENGAKVEFNHLPTLMADETQMLQLMQNLIHNAIKFKKREIQPVIKIDSKETDEEWRISVSDNGIGIDPAYQERIFMIFQRLHTRSEYPGSGIGLAMCKKIVERHNGRIWVDSKEGQGTTFYFTIDKNLS
ncbi:MAG TPA: ATP-binding protein [Balneolales bacterium]|nr:ATP-binding protein [Balneolales bacterium]